MFNTRRFAFETIEDTFGAGVNALLTVAVDRRSARCATGALATLAHRVGSRSGVVAVVEPALNGAGDTAILRILRDLDIEGHRLTHPTADNEPSQATPAPDLVPR